MTPSLTHTYRSHSITYDANVGDWRIEHGGQIIGHALTDDEARRVVDERSAPTLRQTVRDIASLVALIFVIAAVGWWCSFAMFQTGGAA